MSVIFYYKDHRPRVRIDDVDHVWGGNEIVLMRGIEEVMRVTNSFLISYEVWDPK